MKHSSNTRRLRSRGNGKRHSGPRNQTFESNGPEGKIRGTAQQVLEKYLALGRDASSSGDPIAAEGFYQHAEHYYRLLNADGFGDRGGDRQRQPNASAGPETVSESAEAASAGSAGAAAREGAEPAY